MKMSEPRTFSSTFTRVSPLRKAPTSVRPIGMPSSWVIASASGRLALAEKPCSRPSMLLLSRWGGAIRAPGARPGGHADDEFTVRHIVRDDRARAGRRIVADTYRRSQERVYTDERAVTD